MPEPIAVPMRPSTVAVPASAATAFAKLTPSRALLTAGIVARRRASRRSAAESPRAMTAAAPNTMAAFSTTSTAGAK